ncbi:MarR family winged helix-turn-helix transcriptional regulator [Actinophytocola oryzae]|uniref:DNA-binding MarR family transcriptional regulator n=1 Tax=Actinophytocola oryzae TaxID=502181 RepID=A0A4R7VN04_9PSEU|nr:MarR family transcriptional regulator [Actinophytocola oryzae]TDV50924.1 DNA-binding MarR family transcriptional regulator [Actinophytocola oryzae]
MNTGLLLLIPYRWLENRVLSALAAAGFADVTVAQLRIVQLVGPHGTRLTELAAQAQVTKQTAGFLVDQLEKAGWVERVPDPSDRRARLVRVAERGRAAIPVATAAVAEVEAEWTAHLGEARMTELRRTLADLRDLTDQAPQPH